MFYQIVILYETAMAGKHTEAQTKKLWKHIALALKTWNCIWVLGKLLMISQARAKNHIAPKTSCYEEFRKESMKALTELIWSYYINII